MPYNNLLSKFSYFILMSPFASITTYPKRFGKEMWQVLQSARIIGEYKGTSFAYLLQPIFKRNYQHTF